MCAGVCVCGGGAVLLIFFVRFPPGDDDTRGYGLHSSTTASIRLHLMACPLWWRDSPASSTVTNCWRPRCWLTALVVQDAEYGDRSLPPALEQFCEGNMPSIAETAKKPIMSALFVPSLQAMKLGEVEDLARQPQKKLRELFLRRSPAAVVSNMKSTSVSLSREVVATVLELTREAGEELADVDTDVFKRDIASLQVGGQRLRDREAVSRRPPCDVRMLQQVCHGPYYAWTAANGGCVRTRVVAEDGLRWTRLDPAEQYHCWG